MRNHLHHNQGYHAVRIENPSIRREDNNPNLRIREFSQGIWLLDGKQRRLLTKNLTPGKKFFEYEETWIEAGTEYRVLDPRRSKLGAALAKGLQKRSKPRNRKQDEDRDGLEQSNLNGRVGASHGYTPSYVSDIVGPEGFVFCLDVAPRVVRDLIFVCEQRENMAPLLCDAKHPETYADKLPKEGVDVVYQDIAQKNQVEIFLANCDAFLKRGGVGLLALKARSIDVTRYPTDIFKQIKRQFETGELAARYVIVDYRELDPFEKDHAFFVVKRR